MTAFYADGIKLFLPVCGFQDCLTIPRNWNVLVKWLVANLLGLNVGKCKLMTFSTQRHPFVFSYMLRGIIFDHRVNAITDWRVILAY
jgi:hypothetical protein